MIENKNFWCENDNVINLKTECKNIKINCGHNQTIEIDKLFASTIFCKIRITPVLGTCTWKIERERITQDEQGNDVCKWEVIYEFDAQESINFDE